MSRSLSMTNRRAACQTSRAPRIDTIQGPISVTYSKILLLSTALVALASCSEQPLDMEDMSERLRMELAPLPVPVEGGAVSLEGAFGAAVARAVTGHEGYRAALALEREAMSRIGVAQSARRPQLAASGTVGGIRETGSDGSTDVGVAGGVNLSQLVYDGGESVAAVNRSTAEALGARAERAARGNELALEAARAWIDVWQYDQRLDLLRARSSEMDTLVTQIERMASTGMLDRAALDSARRQIIDITLEESRLQTDRAEARVRFNRFFGRDPGTLERPEELIPLAVARAQAQRAQQAPTLEARAAAVIAARNAVAEAQSAFRPRARLQASARAPMSQNDSTDLILGIGVEYSFSDGGRRQRLLEASESRAEALQEELRDAQSTLEAELQAALSRLAGIERAMPLVAEQIRLSASEGQTARSQIATGQSTLRQLVEAEIEQEVLQASTSGF
ncbi:TolC family protein [Plastorhodobacter daqingensis]|uniref:TolC family protein n=1 Tax=Plastorhodobacter daqingensis TaxID=1387281 RepID=A0ABW2USM6_9RHOB